MSDREAYDNLVERVELEIPGFRVGFKNRVTWGDWKLKIAAVVVGLFNKQFMTHFTTTLYPVVYFPTAEWVENDPRKAFRVLAHEYVHLRDERERRIWFPLSYLFPQILAVFSLGAIGAIWSLWFLLFLMFLLALLPWPAPWRSKWEMRGYAMNMANDFWIDGQITEERKEHIVGIFTGMNYYRMWPNAKAVREEIDLLTQEIETEELKKEEPYSSVHTLWVSSKI